MIDSIPEPNNLPKNPKLSVCMIVRDEEKNLPRCLNSVESVADELVIVDTGSKDKTVSIAKDYGAKVFHFQWCDDFSRPRNESIKNASGDWILQIDADEELLPDSSRVLRKAMLNPNVLLYTITVDNGPTYPSRFFHPGRLFRNHPELRYSRPYHETLRESERALRASEPNWQIGHEPNIVLKHYGYDESYLKEGGKYAREIRILKSHLNENPDDLDMAIRLAEILICVEQSAEAIRVSKNVLTANPNFARARHALGAAYWKAGKYNEAEIEFEKTVRIDPEFGFARYRLGVAYCMTKRFDEAITELEKALAKEPHFAPVQCWLGISYCKNGLLDRGIAALEHSIAIDPNLALANFWLGAAYNIKGQYEDAIDSFTKARNLDPNVDESLTLNLSTAHFNLGAFLHSQGKLDEAIEQYQKSLELNPDDSQTHYNLGMAYDSKGMVDKAIAEILKTISSEPLFSQAHYRLALLYTHKKEYDQAAMHCNKAIELGVQVAPQLIDFLKPLR